VVYATGFYRTRTRIRIRIRIRKATMVHRGFEYEYRCTEYRFAEYEYEEIRCDARTYALPTINSRRTKNIKAWL